MPSTTVNVRYMVDDVDAAVGWYTKHLGFTLLSNAAPAFADVTLGSLRLLLSGPKSSAGRPMPDGERPGPGGWNRIHLIVDDLPAEVARLRAGGFRLLDAQFITQHLKTFGATEVPRRQYHKMLADALNGEANFAVFPVERPVPGHVAVAHATDRVT